MATLIEEGLINEKGILLPNGLKLLIHYFQTKKKSQTPIYYVNADYPKTFINFLTNFVTNSPLNELYFVLHYNDHYSILKCEKDDSHTHIISLDSIGYNLFPSVINHIYDNPKLTSKIICYSNITVQQTDSTSCYYFALKNLSLLLSSQKFIAELHDKQLIKKGDYFFNIMRYGYTLPARFMHLAQSYDNLQKYIKENHESKQTLRINKKGFPQNLFDYARQPREGYGVNSPKPIKNRHKKSKQEWVFKNNSIDYFRNKYEQHVLPNLLESLSAEEIKSIYAKYQLPKLEQEEKNTFSPKIR